MTFYVFHERTPTFQRGVAVGEGRGSKYAYDTFKQACAAAAMKRRDSERLGEDGHFEVYEFAKVYTTADEGRKG